MFKNKIIILSILFTLVILILSATLYIKLNHNDSYFVETKIKTSSYYVESITSVITNNSKLNNIITTYIEKQKNLFYDKINNQETKSLIGRDELNIDYKFDYLNKNIWNISLITSMSGPSFEYPYYQIDCFNFDKKQEKQLTIKNVLSSTNNFSEIQNTVFNEINKTCPNCLSKTDFSLLFTKEFKTFQITDNGVIFYFNPFILKNNYHNIIPVTFITNDLSIKNKKNKSNITKKKNVPSSKIIDYKKKVVALTFDDGPSKYTEEIIKTLKANEVNATFFILGNKVHDYSDTLKKLLDNGNEIGNHSYNHKWLSKLQVNDLIDQIEKTQNIIKEQLNYVPKYLRPTYGSVTKRIRTNTNLNIVLWTVDTKDWKHHDVNKIIHEATNNIEDGDIILMHDIFSRTKEALKKIIPILKEQGFQFVTISELEEVKILRKLDKANI